MFMPPNCLLTSTTNLQLHSMLRLEQGIMCAGRNSKSCACLHAGLGAARCSGHTFDCLHESHSVRKFRQSNSSAPLLSVCSAP